jgi:6-phosphogluconolactonase
MVALAARGDMPWRRIEWWWAEERSVSADDPRSNIRIARESLLESRGIPAARIHVPPVTLGGAPTMARAYAETLVTTVGHGAVPALDLILLALGRDGSLAGLAPGDAALAATSPVAAVAPNVLAEEPRLARITLTPPVFQAARHVIVAATTDAVAPAVAQAFADPQEPHRLPAHLLRPSDRVSWFLDRAAAARLLRDAREAANP